MPRLVNHKRKAYYKGFLSLDGYGYKNNVYIEVLTYTIDRGVKLNARRTDAYPYS